MSPEETKKKQLFFTGKQFKGQTQNIANKSHSNQSSYDGRVGYKKASVASQKQKDLFAEVFGKSHPEVVQKKKVVKGYMRSTNTSENKVITSPNLSLTKKANSRNSSNNNRPIVKEGGKKMFNLAGASSQANLGFEPHS